MKTYMTFQGPTFTLQVPTDWFVTSTPRFQAIFTPVEQGDNEVKGNLIVSVRLVKEVVTAEAVAMAARETQEKEYAEYEVIQEGSDTAGAADSFRRTYRWYNRDKELYIIQQQSYAIYQNKLYTLTATRPDSEEGGQTAAILETMMDSFELAADE